MQKKTSQLIQSIFDVNNPMLRLAERGFDLCLLNLLFVMTSLPLVTLGTAKLSLIACLREVNQSQKIKVISLYFREFRKNWREGLGLGLLELGITGFCLFDLYLIQGQTDPIFQLLRVVCYGILILSQLIWVYLYPLAARYAMPLGQLLKQSLLLAGVHLPVTLLVLLAMGGLVVLLSLSGLSLLLTLSAFILFGYASLTYLFLRVLDKILIRYEKQNDTKELL